MTFAVGLAVGYVLGSKAGRERYEEIRRMAQRVADSPRVQEAAGVVGAQVSKAAEMARSRMGGTLQQRVPFLGRHDHGDEDTGTGWPDERLESKKADESGIPY